MSCLGRPRYGPCTALRHRVRPCWRRQQKLLLYAPIKVEKCMNEKNFCICLQSNALPQCTCNGEEHLREGNRSVVKVCLKMPYTCAPILVSSITEREKERIIHERIKPHCIGLLRNNLSQNTCNCEDRSREVHKKNPQAW